MSISKGKLVIVGAGKVGDAVLNSVLQMNLLDDIVVVNRNKDKALGEVLDASHTNPLDILTYHFQKKYDYPVNRIFGTGTLLDTARFNKMLGDLCHVDAKNVVGFVLGEHGATSFIPWNTVNIVGVPFNELASKFGLAKPIDKDKLLRDTKIVGPHIVDLKGYTSSGVSLAACRIIGAIVRNEHCIVPVSTVMRGQYGCDDVAMSLPCVLSENGIDRVLELPLDDEGMRDFRISHDHLRELLNQI